MGEPPARPRVRMRRLRRTPGLRALTRETEDPTRRLVLPAFVRDDPSVPPEVP